MPLLLDHMPFPGEPGEVVVRGERIRIRAHQIILWASVTLDRVKSPNPTAIPFPVILDTGHTHSLSIQERHLVEWADLRPEMLSVRMAIRERGQRILLRAANIWVHPNMRGIRDQLADRPPHLLEAKRGIAVYPPGEFPRLPILGLRAIAENNLILKIDGRKRTATLRKPPWYWPFQRSHQSGKRLVPLDSVGRAGQRVSEKSYHHACSGGSLYAQSG
jgi:hypothetical protein